MIDVAVSEQRIIVTEDFADFATLVEQRHQVDGPASFPSRGALPTHLARHLHRWAEENPELYASLHRP